MSIVLVGIDRMKIEEWGGLVLDWMSLSCIPAQVCYSTNLFKDVWRKTFERTEYNMKVYQCDMRQIYICLFKSPTCWSDGRQRGLQLSIGEQKKQACKWPKQPPLLPHSPKNQDWEKLGRMKIMVLLTTRGCSTTTIHWSVMAKECM